MKRIHGDTKNRVLGLSMLIATLFGSAVAKADVVLDWNVIAVNTAVTNGQNPFARAISPFGSTAKHPIGRQIKKKLQYRSLPLEDSPKMSDVVCAPPGVSLSEVFGQSSDGASPRCCSNCNERNDSCGGLHCPA